MKVISKWADRPSIIYPIAIALLSLVIYAQVAAFSPGVYSGDSADQLQQALSRNFTDWHPPFMAWVWSILISLTGLYTSMFFLHYFLLYCAGLAWIFILVKLDVGRIALLVPLAVASPVFTNFSGVVWKDVGFAFTLLFATGIFGLSLVLENVKPALRSLLFLLIVVLSIYALGTRTNGIFAIIPLLAAASWTVIRQNSSTFRRKIFSLAGATLGLLISSILVVGTLESMVIKPEKRFPFQYVQMFDLLGVGARTGQDFMPEFIVSQEQYSFDETVSAYELTKLPPGNANHIFFTNERGTSLISGSSNQEDQRDLMRAWLHAISSQPFDYLAHRLGVFSVFMKGGIYTHELPQQAQVRNTVFQQNSVELGDTIGSNACLPGCKSFATFMTFSQAAIRGTPLHSGWFWMFVLIANLVVSIIAQGGRLKSLGIVTSASGLIYLLTFLAAAPASDFRYLYWSVVAAVFGSILSLAFGVVRRASRSNSRALSGS